MATPELQENSIYIALYVRNDPHVPNNFHWALYHHRSRFGGGVKYHIRNEGDGWMPGHESVTAIWKEFLLVGLFRVAEPPFGVDYDVVDRIMRTFDRDLNTVGLTCRVWVRWVLEVMRQPVLDSPSFPTVPPDLPIIRFDDVAVLEAEVMAWGDEHAQSAIDNVQPRPVGASKVTGCCN